MLCTLPGHCITFNYKSLLAGTTELMDCLHFCLVHFLQVSSLYCRHTLASENTCLKYHGKTHLGKHRQLSEPNGRTDTRGDRWTNESAPLQSHDIRRSQIILAQIFFLCSGFLVLSLQHLAKAWSKNTEKYTMLFPLAWTKTKRHQTQQTSDIKPINTYRHCVTLKKAGVALK